MVLSAYLKKNRVKLLHNLAFEWLQQWLIALVAVDSAEYTASNGHG